MKTDEVKNKGMGIIRIRFSDLAELLDLPPGAVIVDVEKVGKYDVMGLNDELGIKVEHPDLPWTQPGEYIMHVAPLYERHVTRRFKSWGWREDEK